MRRIEAWRALLRTLAAMVLLGHARLLIALVPLRLWRRRLGLAGSAARAGDRTPEARRLSRHVERAAARLPFTARCLPRAMALSIMLRRARIAHCVVFAIRPRGATNAERLHAWVEHDGTLLIGDEPGPWVELLRLGAA